MKKLLSLLLVLCLLASLSACAPADPVISGTDTDPAETPAAGNNTVILFTNDIHCAVNDNITAAGISNIKSTLEAAGKNVLLVDCGDALQGDSLGTLSSGEFIIDIMNQIGYRAATPGNHDFDYGIEQFFALADRSDFPYVSATFSDQDGNLLLDPYVILESDGAEFAFVGASTPQTLTTSKPTYFQNEAGEFIYGFRQGGNGEEFYAAIQSAVDAARSEGADYVFILSHLGSNEMCAPYSSYDLILNTNGIDAVLDGHSHSVIESETVKNKDGQDVLLSSTGTKLQNIGCLSVSEDGKLSAKLINDGGVGDFVEDINTQFDEQLNKVVAHTDVDLYIEDPKTGNRMIRSRETNLGDLVADAVRYVSGADIGVNNGGGIRANIPSGDITYGQLLSVVPFGNELCVVEISGQELWDALELSASYLPYEFGGFFQVSGLSFTIDLSVKSPVILDQDGMFVSAEGEHRVKDVIVGEEPLDPEKIYTLACHDYELHNKGDGYSMFADNTFLLDGFIIDNQAFIHYVMEGLDGNVGTQYQDPYGQARIKIIGG